MVSRRIALGLAALTAIVVPLSFAGADPALAVASNAALAVAVPSAQDVVAVVKNADGSTQVTTWDPAPGVTPAQLAAELKAAKVPGVTLRSVTSKASAALPCTYLTAKTLVCPVAKWPNNGFADPQIVFMDHTSSAWPVSAAVATWNTAVGIDSSYSWYTAGCPGGGRYCLHVYSGTYPESWSGLTTYKYSGTALTAATVQLNNRIATTAAQRRMIACHELGHALGLDHNTSTGTCMYEFVTSRELPNSTDFGLLERIYT